MAGRVLIGKKGSEYGLFVSQNGQDVQTTTEPLAFDSRAAASLTVHSFGQGQLLQTDSPDTMTHSLGYIPLYAVRWCNEGDMYANGYASKVYSPYETTGDFFYASGEECDDDEEDGEASEGIDVSANTSHLTITTKATGTGNGTSGGTIRWAAIIFLEEDFTKNMGL